MSRLELLHLFWDVWCFHGCEPSSDLKNEVRQLGLSDLYEDRGTTKQALGRRLVYEVII